MQGAKCSARLILRERERERERERDGREEGKIPYFYFSKAVVLSWR